VVWGGPVKSRPLPDVGLGAAQKRMARMLKVATGG